MVSLEGSTNQTADQLTPTEPKVSDETIKIVQDLLKNPTKKNSRAALVALGMSEESVNEMKMDQLIAELAKFDITKPERGANELAELADTTIKKIEGETAAEVAATEQAVPDDALATERDGLFTTVTEITAAGSEAVQKIEQVEVAAAAPEKPKVEADNSNFLAEFDDAEIDRDAAGRIIVDPDRVKEFAEKLLSGENTPDNATREKETRLELMEEARRVENEAMALVATLPKQKLDSKMKEQVEIEAVKLLTVIGNEKSSNDDIRKAIDKFKEFKGKIEIPTAVAEAKPELTQPVKKEKTDGVDNVISQDDIDSLLAEMDSGSSSVKSEQPTKTASKMPDDVISQDDIDSLLAEVERGEQKSKKPEDNSKEALKEQALVAEREKLVAAIDGNEERIKELAGIVKDWIKEGVSEAEVPELNTAEKLAEIKEQLAAALAMPLDVKQASKVAYYQRRLGNAKPEELPEMIQSAKDWLKQEGLVAVSKPEERSSKQIDEIIELQEKAERMYEYLVGISEPLDAEQTKELVKHAEELEYVRNSDKPAEIQQAIVAVTDWLERTFPKNVYKQIVPDKSEPESILYPEEELFKKAQAIIAGMEKPTVSTLQRKLKIGFNKASALFDRIQNPIATVDTAAVEPVPLTDAEIQPQLDAIISQCDFVDIHPAEIMKVFEGKDWQNIRVILTDNNLNKADKLKAAKEVIEPQLKELLKDKETALNHEEIAAAVVKTLYDHVEAEVTRQLAQFDVAKARQLGTGMAVNIVRAVLIGKAIAATGLITASAPLALTTGGVLAAWLLIKKKTEFGKKISQKLDKVFNIKLWGKSRTEQVEEQKDTAQQTTVEALSDTNLAALVSNTLRQESSKEWEKVRKTDDQIKTELKAHPDDFKLWQEQTANMTKAQHLFLAQSLLELQEGEYANELAETRLHMALQKTVTAGMYDRTQQQHEVAMDQMKKDNPDKFKWITKGLKKYGEVTSGTTEGWAGSIATVGLGAATVFAVRETSWGRMAAGAIGGAMVGLSFAERQQKKNELAVWQEIDKLVTEGELKIKDAEFPMNNLEQLTRDAQDVEAQWQIGLFKNNPLLQQRAENFIYHVKKLVAEHTEYADELISKMGHNTRMVEISVDEQLLNIKKALKQGHLTQVFQVAGGAIVGGALGFAGMRLAEHQAEIHLEDQLDKALNGMPVDVQIKVISHLAGNDPNVVDVTQLTHDQLTKVFTGGHLNQVVLAQQADAAYQEYLSGGKIGFKSSDFAALDTDPLKRLNQLAALEKGHASDIPHDRLIGRVLAASAGTGAGEMAVNVADLGLSSEQVTELKIKIAENNGKFDHVAAVKTVEQINAFSNDPAVRQGLTQSLVHKGVLDSPASFEQLQVAATAKASLGELPYKNEPLADYLMKMKEVNGNPEKFIQRVAWMEQALGGPLAEHKLELSNLIDKASHDGGADLNAVLNANQVMEVKTGDTLTKLLHQQFDLKNDSHPELTKNFVNKYSGTTVENTTNVTQQLVDKAIGRAGVIQENLLHSGNKVIVTNSGIVETIKGAAALDSERVSEAALRTNYLTSILGVPKDSISDVQVGSGRSFEFTSQGQELHINNAGTGHPEITADVDGESIKLNLDHSGHVVTADGVDPAEVKSLDNFVHQGPDSFVGATITTHGETKINGALFDFGETAHVRIHEISPSRVLDALPKGQGIPHDAKFFSIHDLDRNTSTVQVRLGGDAVLDAPTDKLVAAGSLRAELGHQAQYLQAARENIATTYNMDQHNAAELLAVARRADGSVHTLLTETPNQPAAAIQRIMEAVGSKREMLQRNGHFNVERIKLASTLTDEAHKFTPQETQSALEITRDTRLNDGVNLKLAEAAILHSADLMKEVIGTQTKIGTIATKGDMVVINAGTKEFPVAISIKGPMAHLDVPGKDDVYLGTTDQQLKGIGRIIEAGVKDEPGGSQAEAEKVLDGVWHDDKSFVHRLTGQEYSAKMDESPKTLVDLIATEKVGKNYNGEISKLKIFNEAKLDKNSHQLQFDVNKGVVDARYNIDQRSGVILRENEVLTERQFAERLKADIAAARKHVGE